MALVSSLALAAEPVSLEVIDTPVRWLELWKLVETLFPWDPINRVCQFTVRLDGRHGNLSQRQQQQMYLRVLSTLLGFDASYGVFPPAYQ